MSARIKIYESAFRKDFKEYEVAVGNKVSEYKGNSENCLYFKDGKKIHNDYIVQNGDVIEIRQFAGVPYVIGALLVYEIANGINMLFGNESWTKQAIDSVFKQNNTTSSADVGGTVQNIPTVSGAKNRSGANGVIPLLLGETLYTPVLAAQTFTDIDPTDGSDGENQYFHGLYCLGYNDIDVKSVSLGIFPLSTDEHNGTSGNLDCQNIVSHDASVTIPIKYENANGVTSFGNPEADSYFLLPITSEDYEIESVTSIANYNLRARLRQGLNLFNSGYSWTNLHITSVEFVGTTHIKVTIQEKPTGLFDYIFLSGTVNVNAVVKAYKDTSHYDTNKYHQQLELQQGDSEVSLFPQKVVQENFGAEMLHPENADPLIIMPFSAKYPQKIQLEVQFQNLQKIEDDGSLTENEVELCVAYSKDGGATFLPFPAFIQSSNTIAVTDLGTANFEDNSGSYRITKFKGKKNKAMRFICEKTFTFDEVFNTDALTRLKNNAIEFKVWRRGEDKSASDSKLQYKVCFSAIRTWCYDYKKTKAEYEDNGTEILIPQAPVAEKYRDMTARLGFKIKAGDEIAGTIDELNVLEVSKARYCTITEDGQTGEKTYTWSTWTANQKDTVPTNNPASLALLLLQHPMRGAFAYSDDQLDMDSFGRFYEWCNRTDVELINSEYHRYTANGVASKEFKTFDLVNQILACGHGKLVLKGNVYGVWFDCPQDTPVMLLNNQNVLEASNTKNFDDTIDGYSCKFIDSLNDYQEDTQICVPKDCETDESQYKLENLELPWITDIGRAYRECMYRLACKRLRPETWNRKVSVDGNLLDIGCLVAVQDDTISVGIGEGAQIKSVTEDSNNILAIEVDYPFNVEDTTKTYGIKIQHSDSLTGVNVRTYELSAFNTTGEKTTLIFATPIAKTADYIPKVGEVVAFGLFEKITTNAICVGKKENGDGTYSLNLVPYQEAIYEAEYGYIPKYVSNVTSAKESGVPISEEVPNPSYSEINTFLETTTDNILNGEPSGVDNPNAVTSLVANATKDFINLSWSFSGTGLANAIQNFHVYISRDNEATYTEIGTTGTNTFEYKFNRSDSVDGYPEKTAAQNANHNLASYSFKVVAENTYGKLSTATVCYVTDTNYGTWTVQAPYINKRVSGRNVTLTFVQPSRSDNAELYGNIRYKVSIKRYDDSQFYKPDEDSDPRASENNYKDTTSQVNYVDSGEMYQQVLPLEGQNDTEPLPIDTQYVYSVVAYNETSGGADSSARAINVIALGTSAADIVASAITTNKLSDDCVTADKIHAGTITGDKIAATDLSANGATLGKISGEGIDTTDPNNFWNLEDGEFRIGDESQYFHAQKTNGVYQIEFKVGNFELTSRATNLEGETFIYDDKEVIKTQRLKLTSKGITLQKKVNNDWKSVGFVNLDANGNMFITNEGDPTALPTLNSQMPTGSVVYHLDTTLTDMDSSYADQNNSKNLVFDGTTANLIDMEAVQSNRVYEGEVQIPTVTDDFCFWIKKQITIGVKQIAYNGSAVSTQNDLVKIFNNNASTSWGLTAAQVSANLAKYEE